MTRHREFDAAEMSLSSYLISLEADAPFVAIPPPVDELFAAEAREEFVI